MHKDDWLRNLFVELVIDVWDKFGGDLLAYADLVERQNAWWGYFEWIVLGIVFKLEVYVCTKACSALRTESSWSKRCRKSHKNFWTSRKGASLWPWLTSTTRAKTQRHPIVMSSSSRMTMRQSDALKRSLLMRLLTSFNKLPLRQPIRHTFQVRSFAQPYAQFRQLQVLMKLGPSCDGGCLLSSRSSSN